VICVFKFKLRKRFKIAVGLLLVLAAFGYLGYKQADLSKRVAVVEKKQAVKPQVVVITATPEPTASPSATPTIAFRNFYRPVVTKPAVK
jgi:small neutral amino acid transporter SnatA (MarC family)